MILGVKLPKKIVVNFSDHDRHKEIFVALIYETMAKLPDGSSDGVAVNTVGSSKYINFYHPKRGLVNQASFGPRILKHVCHARHVLHCPGMESTRNLAFF